MFINNIDTFKNLIMAINWPIYEKCMQKYNNKNKNLFLLTYLLVNKFKKRLRKIVKIYYM